jgi:membrane protein YdbS with pleckstrin-like domain
MAQEQVLLNLENQPFPSFEQAARMRNLLTQEEHSGRYQYHVSLYDQNDGTAGFVVIRKQHTPAVTPVNRDKTGLADTAQDSGSTTQKANKHHHSHQYANTDVIPTRVYRTALRTYLLSLPLIVAGLVIMAFAWDIWIGIFTALGLNSLPQWIDGQLLISGTQFLAGLWVFWLLAGVLLNYFGTALIVDNHGVTLKKGIITRDETHVRFNEIRTIGLRQGILDRLLGIGILEFASSGTDGVDIRFFNLANPVRIKSEIEAIIHRQNNPI